MGSPSYLQELTVLIQALATMRPQFEQGISEFELLGRLKQPPFEFFSDTALRDNLSMFQAHFLLFHALYRLSEQWREQGQGELDIFTTNIVLLPHAPEEAGQSGNCLNEFNAVRDYYLDLDNLTKTSEQDVSDLIDSFWQQMEAGFGYADCPELLDEALLQLGLSDFPQSQTELKAYYRQTLHRVHPDKGGNNAQAERVIQAYRVLSRHLRYQTPQ